MLSTLFPPDPTLTVDNVRHIMEKVKDGKKQRSIQVKRTIHMLIFMSTANGILHGNILPGHYTIITRWLQLRK